jgi:hypothetical protein
MKESAALEIKKHLLYLLEFLRISPSYDLAKQIRTHKWTNNQISQKILALYKDQKGLMDAAEIKKVIFDFEQVLKTYDLYGDISGLGFEEWWKLKGIFIYGSEYDKPKVHQIARIEKNEKQEAFFYKALDHHFKKIRPQEGEPPALILSIPLGIPKRGLLKQVSRYIDTMKVELPSKSQRAKIPMATKRLRADVYEKMIRLVWYKATYPNLAQWELAIRAKISPKLSQDLDTNSKPTKFNVDQRNKLNVVTSRMLTKAKLVAENTARGDFPSDKDLTLPDFDFDEIYKRIKLSKPKLKPQVN